MNSETVANREDSTLFSSEPAGFAWATGIEDTFIGQTERIGERPLDEYALTHHYLYWRADIDRAADLGVRAMRYGIPWYKVEPRPGVFDWAWVDQVLEYIASKGIAIIIDLMHYGTPLWLDNGFLNSDYPVRVAAYAAEFTRRYKHIVTHYTPLNEPWITVAFTGLHGIWPPYLRGDDGAVKILRQVARGLVLTTEAIRAEHPAAIIVSVDAGGEAVPAAPHLAELATLATARTYITTDLVTGRVDPDHLLAAWLLRHGMSGTDLRWHQERATRIDIMGVNYYPESAIYGLVERNGLVVGQRMWGGVEGFERVLTASYQRYGLPIMVTETSTNGPLELRSQWLADSLAAIPRLRGAGVPLVGYTWWPMFDLVDWSYRHGARPLEEFFTRLGPAVLDPDHLKTMINFMRWTTLEQLPLEAYLARMGLYELEMGFDGTFTRVHTSLVDTYRDAISSGGQLVGPIADSGTASAD